MPDIITMHCIRWAQAQETILHLNIQPVLFSSSMTKQFTDHFGVLFVLYLLSVLINSVAGHINRTLYLATRIALRFNSLLHPVSVAFWMSGGWLKASGHICWHKPVFFFQLMLFFFAFFFAAVEKLMTWKWKVLVDKAKQRNVVVAV